MAAVNLAQSIRNYGHLAAQLDPLGSPPPGDPSLALENYGLTEDDLRQLPGHLVGGPIGAQSSNALDAIERLRQVYSAHIGFDNDHIRLPEERDWLREAAESRRYRPPADPGYVIALLERLTQVETFEQFLQRAYPTKYRFSVEGLDMMVPMMDEVIVSSAESGIATALNEFALSQMTAAGMKLAVVGTGGDDAHAPARRAYEKVGYIALPIVRYHKAL